MTDLGYDLWLLVSFVAAVAVTKYTAESFGFGWGIAAFFASVFLAAFLASQFGLELDGACYDYGPQAQAEDYC